MSIDVRRLGRIAPLLAMFAGCDSPSAPEHPTWGDVEPIVAGNCTHCHGGAARVTGSGYRFDFYDMAPEICGDAGLALGPNPVLAKGLAPLIAQAITSSRSDIRPRMPPVPAQYLADWEWKTILRWAADPQKGVKGRGQTINRPPTITINGTSEAADQTLDVTAVIADADGDPVVGIIRIGDEVLKMERSGAFSARLDTSTWEAGQRPVSASLCDGWSGVSHDLGFVQIKHKM